MALRLKNSSGNYIALDAPSSIATDVTLTLPNTDGDSGQYLQTNGSGGLSWATPTDTTTNLTRGTEVATTSGTEVIYDNLPANIRRLQVVINNVSTSGTAGDIKFLMRTGDPETDVTSGYYSITSYQNNSGGGSNTAITNGFNFWLNVAAERVFGLATFTNVGSNQWVYSHVGGFFSNFVAHGGGYVDLGALLTGIKITTGNGSTFDNGSVNIFYEV